MVTYVIRIAFQLYHYLCMQLQTELTEAARTGAQSATDAATTTHDGHEHSSIMLALCYNGQVSESGHSLNNVPALYYTVCFMHIMVRT